jgi:hypothetical protein
MMAMVVRNAIARLAVVLMLGAFSARVAKADDCARGANNNPMATGSGNAGVNAANAGAKRLGAERAAFLDATNKLKKCLGDRVKSVTGWSLSPVRYFDADPIVEVDVMALFDKTPTVTVIGSALPSTTSGGNAKSERIKTTTGAKTLAQRNAKEALRAVFPTQGETEGDISSRLMGSLGACSTDEITYWDDAAVTVKLTCGKSPATPDPTPSGQPAIGKH